MTGGFEGIVKGPTVPGMGPMISIRTDPEAMLQEGLGDFGRPIRRNMQGMQSMQGGNPMPIVQRFTPMEGGVLKVNKLE